MSTLPLNDRATVGLIAIAGQTDLPADFRLPPKNNEGQYEGLYLERRRGSTIVILTMADFSIVNVALNGWTARLNVAAQAGDVYTIFSLLPQKRDTSFGYGGAIRTEPLEAELTRATMVAQELWRELERAAKGPLGELGPSLPRAADRAGKVAIFDEDGNVTPDSMKSFEEFVQAVTYDYVGRGEAGGTAPLDGASRLPIANMPVSVLSDIAVRQIMFQFQYGLAFDGVTDDGPALTAAYAAGCREFLISGPCYIGTSRTFAYGVTWQFSKNGSLTVAATRDLHIQGTVIAPERQIFFGEGRVLDIRVVNVAWFGAIAARGAYPTVDSLPALNRAWTCVSSGVNSGGGRSAIIFNGGKYGVSDTWETYPAVIHAIDYKGAGQNLGGTRISPLYSATGGPSFDDDKPLMRLNGATRGTVQELGDWTVSGIGFETTPFASNYAGIQFGSDDPTTLLTSTNYNRVDGLFCGPFRYPVIYKHARKVEFANLAVDQQQGLGAITAVWIDIDAGGTTGDVFFNPNCEAKGPGVAQVGSRAVRISAAVGDYNPANGDNQISGIRFEHFKSYNYEDHFDFYLSDGSCISELWLEDCQMDGECRHAISIVSEKNTGTSPLFETCTITQCWIAHSTGEAILAASLGTGGAIHELKILHNDIERSEKQAIRAYGPNIKGFEATSNGIIDCGHHTGTNDGVAIDIGPIDGAKVLFNQLRQSGNYDEHCDGFIRIHADATDIHCQWNNPNQRTTYFDVEDNSTATSNIIATWASSGDAAGYAAAAAASASTATTALANIAALEASVNTTVAALDLDRKMKIARYGSQKIIPSFQNFISAKLNKNGLVCEAEMRGGMKLTAYGSLARLPSIYGWRKVSLNVNRAICDIEYHETIGLSSSRTTHTRLVPMIDGAIKARINYAGQWVEALKTDQHQIGKATIYFNQESTTTAPTLGYPWNTSNYSNWFDANTDLVCFVAGQSNAEGVNYEGTADPLIATTPLYPDNVLMPSFGVRLLGASVTGFAPLVENDTQITNRRESLCSGFANHLAQQVIDNVGVTPTIIMAISALTGQTISYLGRGSTQYMRLLTAAKEIVDLRREMGRKVVFTVIWVQGEADRFRAIGNHMASLKQLVNQLNADLMLISGQSEPVIMFAVPVNSGTIYDLGASNFSNFGPALAMARLKDHPLIRIVDPHYSKPITDYDHLHLKGLGQNRQGQMTAVAAFAEFAGVGWAAFAPEDYEWQSSTVLDLIVTVPNEGNLAIVTGEAVTPTTASTEGFQIASLSGLLTFTVSIPAAFNTNTKANRIRFTFSAPVTEQIVMSYALRQDGSTGGHGPEIGGRGTIASDRQYASLYDGYLSRDWMLPFLMQFPAP